MIKSIMKIRNDIYTIIFFLKNQKKIFVLTIFKTTIFLCFVQTKIIERKMERKTKNICGYEIELFQKFI